MKVLYVMHMIAGLLTSAIFVSAQPLLIEKKTASPVLAVGSMDTGYTPFARGNWQYLLRRNAGYSYMKYSQNGQKLGHQNSLGFNLGANYFVKQGLGVGLELDAMWQGSHYTTDNTSSRWMVYGDIMYGRPLSQNFNLYGKLSVGLGGEHTSYKAGSVSSSSTDNLFGYKIAIGAPIRLFNKGPIYLTPQLSYDYCHTSFDGGSEKDNGLRFGLSFEAYMGCSDHMCDSHHGFSLSKNIYQPGTGFIDFTSRGRFGFGTEKTTYSGSTQQENYSSESVKFGYSYYVLRNIAIGGSLELGGSSQKDKNSNYKVTGSDWMITPMVTLNLPVDNGWNNSFLQAGVGFGSEKTTVNSGSSSSSDKTNIFKYYALVGYNNFFGKRLAFTPRIGYEWNTYKDTDTGIKQKGNGIEIEMGVRLFLGNKWRY